MNLNTRKVIFGQLSGKEFVELSIENAIGYELSLFADLLACVTNIQLNCEKTNSSQTTHSLLHEVQNKIQHKKNHSL
jgi:hypothetical protein